jgi:hypothetical protein
MGPEWQFGCENRERVRSTLSLYMHECASTGHWQGLQKLFINGSVLGPEFYPKKAELCTQNSHGEQNLE